MISFVVKNDGNINNIIETHKIKYVPVKIADNTDIFLYFSGSFKYGGMKYKYFKPSNAEIFSNPVTKVSLKPPPKIGNIFCISKLLKLAIKIKTILTSAIGRIRRFTFKETLKPSLLEMHEPITNNNIKNIIGVI